MITATVRVDARDALEGLALLDKQLPYAVALALNRTADDFQAAERANIKRAFVLRRPDFVLRTVKIENRDRATKARPAVVVQIDPTRDVLAKFEADTVKLPTRGRVLAVPIDERIRNKRGIIPSSKRPRNLGLHRLGLRVVGLYNTFISGGAILQRVGRGRSAYIRVLYAFKEAVPIKPVLRFQATAEETVRLRWRPNMIGAFDVAKRTAKV